MRSLEKVEDHFLNLIEPLDKSSIGAVFHCIDLHKFLLNQNVSHLFLAHE